MQGVCKAIKSQGMYEELKISNYPLKAARPIGSAKANMSAQRGNYYEIISVVLRMALSH